MLTCEQLLSQCVLLIIRLMVHRWAALHPRASLKYETFPLTMKRREPYSGHIKSQRGDAPASLQDRKGNRGVLWLVHLWVSLWYDCEKEGKAADVGGALSLILNRVKVQEFPRKTVF